MPPKPFCHNIVQYLEDPINTVPNKVKNYDVTYFNTFNCANPHAEESIQNETAQFEPDTTVQQQLVD